MKTPPISAPAASPRFARAAKSSAKSSSLLALGLSLGCAPLLSAQIADAQLANTQIADAPIANAQNVPLAASPLPMPIGNAAKLPAPDINVLILAFDDLGAAPKDGMPTGGAPIPATSPAYAPPIPAPAPGAIAPIAPVDGAPANVTPTGFAGPRLQAQWSVLAQKKSKEQKRLEKQAEDAKKFNIDPVAPTPYQKPGRNTGPVAVEPPIVRAPDAPEIVLAAPEVPLAPIVLAPPGRAQLVALPLKRALATQGYKDVQVATPQSPTIIRALGEGRLSSRVLDELQTALATLSANTAAGESADVNATIAAGRAAARIGQATGYRAVVGFSVGAPLAIGVVGAGATPDATTQKIAADMIVADAQRESVEPLKFIETGDTPAIWQELGGASGARLLDGALRDWPATSSENNVKLAKVHFSAARAAYDRGDLGRAQDELNQSLSLDSTEPQSFLLRGDVLRAIDPNAASNAYRKAVELNSTKGEDWARIASSYAYAKTPDWGAALSAGKRALALNYDSAPLRVALATTEYGRAAIFRFQKYPVQAENSEEQARGHLERALEIAPEDPTAVRLLANNLLEKRRFEEAARTLDRIAPRYPKDVEIQSLYATALVNQSGREEDAFAAYSRVWKLSGQKRMSVEPVVYRTLASGFDKRLFNLGKVAVQLSRGVASRAILRETALIQLSKLKEEMESAKAAIAIMQPTSGVSATNSAARVFAADLMDQSLEAFQTYLDTGQGDYFVRGDGLYRSAVAQLNTARGGQ